MCTDLLKELRSYGVLRVLSRGVGFPQIFNSPSGKTMRQTPKSFRGARTCSRSFITVPNLVRLGFHTPPVTVASRSTEIWPFEFRKISTFRKVWTPVIAKFLRRKFENLALASCRTCPILSPPAVSFELHAKVAEEIDLEKVQFSEIQKLRDL